MLEYPLYEMLIDEETEGVYAISLVSRPAMKSHWLAFSEEDIKKVKFAVADEDQHKILAVIARADFPIYRIGENGEEFYAVFSKETIQKISQKFLKNGYQGEINIEHNDDAYVDGVELEQIFIKNSEMGINPVAFPEIEEGSLFGLYKIENEKVWEAVKEGVFTGVSLEGLFKIQPVPQEEQAEPSILNTLDDILNYFK